MLLSHIILWPCDLFYSWASVLFSNNKKFECKPSLESLLGKFYETFFHSADSAFLHKGEFYAMPMGSKSSRVFNHLSNSNYISASTEINSSPHMLKLCPYLSAFLDSGLKYCLYKMCFFVFQRNVTINVFLENFHVSDACSFHKVRLSQWITLIKIANKQRVI